ncbi:low molecular weight protein tyrosine phosphatase family protein [Luteimonas lutimaris]|uniref:Low molecular weight protein tyrosine phosphatase family protein n=1 Tax=Luteimonas lutimaris TaxID=698645 RepID=A0ABP7ME11_9GAMM
MNPPPRARRLLFVCSRNRLRSPTAEQVFADWPGVETASAGLDHDAEVPLTPELLVWADTVFVMERAHRGRLSRRFRAHLDGKRVICLDVPDRYAYMEPALVDLLRRRMAAHLPSG